MSKFLFSLLFFLLIGVNAFAQPTTYPRNDIAFSPTNCYAFTNATIVASSAQTFTNATLVIRNGIIIALGTAVVIPSDALVTNLMGKYIYPSFIDCNSDYGIPARQPVAPFNFNFGQSKMVATNKGAYSWNEAIHPEYDASKTFMVNDDKAKALRSNGFGVVLTHNPDGIARGTGAVVTLQADKENLVMLNPKASAHYSFNKGSSTQDYPNSAMGSVALLRQTYYDAQWYKTKPTSEGTNISLQAFNELQSLPQFFECNDKWTDLRANTLAKEFNQNYIYIGGTNEYQRIADIKDTKARFVLPLNFPLAPDVEDPNDTRFIALSELKNWELAPTNLAAFASNGIAFSITSNGLKDAATFMPNLRKAIQNGLTEAAALDALTITPATYLGMQAQLGSLQVGKLANFLITSNTLFNPTNTIYQNWIQGKQNKLTADGFTDYRGTYNLTVGQQPMQLLLSGEALKPTAKLIIAKDTLKPDFKITDNTINLTYSTKADSSKPNRFSGINLGNSFKGTGTLANGNWVGIIGVKVLSKPDNYTQINKTDTVKKELTKKPTTLSPINYPFTGYGWLQAPIQQTILFTNATVWTSEKAGKLLNTDVLVSAGKILAIGKNLDASKYQNVIKIDATNKHLSAGIIDEHSHIALFAVNECSQTVTAETRMGDVVNPDDVNIYRQLSGGVTMSHLLHGSCNTIGGQTQLIKLRWGTTAEKMKMEGWPGFIKFALGENVKRSSSDQNNRYPDTRMGVEQVLDDAFTRARDYEKLGANKRRDLELDALVEILNNKRFITCHSYVQSEIVALMRIAEKNKFKVNTFTHILEGYKVADKMKQHGVAASTFSDWWAYKMEVQDAIPQNAGIMNALGINVAINSDDAEMARRLNHEAAKIVKYSGVTETDALNMVTINPATMLQVGNRTGSIKVGKDADLVLWSDSPLSIYAKAEKTMVDGIIYFDRDADKVKQQEIAKEKTRLVQKIIAAKKGGEKMGSAAPTFSQELECEDDHSHGKTLYDRLKQRSAIKTTTTTQDDN